MEDFNFQVQNDLLFKSEFDDHFLINAELENNDFGLDQPMSGALHGVKQEPQSDLNQQLLEQEQQHYQQQQQQRAVESQKRTRASGEVLALLITEFNKNQNPNADSRKRISDQTGMPERSVRIWFQNRRAKSRKMEKAAANEKDDPYSFGTKTFGFSRYDNIPLNLNNNYFFIDSKSLTVGSWKRLKSGNLSNDNIFNVKNLSNLSPQSINEIMTNSTDLMVLISKKNFEINYFFCAITDNSKILFRIFYPISSVNNCSISFVQDEDSKDQSCELKLFLNKPPKFAVSFSHLIVQNNNQWSICEDFSEGHQVNDAFIGGTGIPHALTGLEQSLKFMNSFILDYNSANIPQARFDIPSRPSSRSPTGFPNGVSPEQHQQHPLHSEDVEVSQNPLLQQFVQENSKYEFDHYIQQPDGDQFEINVTHDFNTANFQS
jgi:regulatory protein PHO2